MNSVLAIVGAFSKDSVIGRDGRYMTSKIGGNALWSSLGALIAGNAPRVLAVVGTDYPVSVLDELTDVGIDVASVIRHDGPHPVRVTFAHFPDGRRLQPVPEPLLAQMPPAVRGEFIDTTGAPEILVLGSPEGAQIPVPWLTEVDAWHLPLLPLVRHRSVVDVLAGARGRVLSDCPARSDLLGDPVGRLAGVLPALDVFLPSTSDLDVIAPGADPAHVIAALRGSGSSAIVLKAGAHGVYVDDGSAVWSVPAFADAVVDETGAGDCFCGGFLAGLAQTGDLVEAAAIGSASASFAVATEDPLSLTTIDPDATRRRARLLLARVQRHDRILGNPVSTDCGRLATS